MQSKLAYALSVGYETHTNPSFIGDRLSFYSGFELEFGQNLLNSSYQDDNNNISIDVKKAKYDFSTQTVSERAFWHLRYGIYLGFDFYMYKGLYAGMNLMLNAYGKKSYKYSIHSDIDGMEEDFNSNNQVGSFTADFALCPIFHLGWRFR